jgi:hypothetical protein
MGGDGFPFFLPTFPITKDSTFPVKVFYGTKTKLPLVDVNVDVMMRPAKNQSWNSFVITSPVVTDESDAMSIFHPKHYNLGTILPGAAETPIELLAGKRYFLLITTRRKAFSEDIYLDHDENEPGGWKVAACLYSNPGNKLLRGKCD